MNSFSKLILLFSLAFAMLGCGSSEQPSEPRFKAIGGIEPIMIDGEQYFFAYSFDNDRIISPLLKGKEAAVKFAEDNLRQSDGSGGAAYWLSAIEASLSDPSLTDAPGQQVPLKAIKADIESLRRDPTTPRALPSLAPEGYLWYLTSINGEWPDAPAPKPIETAAGKLGLSQEDHGTWRYESASILSGEAPLPRGVAFEDVAKLYLWCHDIIIGNQQYIWSEQLGLLPSKD